MLKIYCNVPTKGMEKEAESLGIPLNEVVLLHNIIMSLRNNPKYNPSTTELKNLYNSNSIELKMYKYAIPYYNVGRVVTPNEPLIERDSSNNLILNTVNINIPIEEYLTQLPKEALQDITNRKELYTVLLWMENLKNTKNLNIENSYKEAIKLLNEYRKLDPSYFEVSKPYKEVESFEKTGQLASTKLVNGKVEITIKKVITPKEFYDYIQGNIESKTSEQKGLVLKEMEKLGITLDKIKEVLNTSEKIKQFIYLHELSHKLNYTEDMKNYNKSNLNAPENIAIELRANMFAWQNMTGEDINQSNKYGNTTFSTSKSNDYRERTKENAEWSDITLALANNLSTKGEILTKEVAGDKYVSYQLSQIQNNAEDVADDLYKQIKAKGKTKDIKLNIAGNGIYSLNKEQSYYNNLLTEVLQKLLDKGITISSIRSGGQTGIDEAGIIAAQRLNIPNKVHTTSDFKFRDKNNKDTSNEIAFKSRFIFNPLGQEGHMTYDNTMRLLDSRKTYSGMITSLQPNQVFVFGSNTEGRHGLGTAKTAKDKFGAIYGQAEGIQGQSYAIITKDLTKDDKKHPSRTKEQIIEQIHKLYEYAKANPNKEFLVAYSSQGKNLNYYTNKEMAEMFASKSIPSNIVFEEGFSKMINQAINAPSGQQTTQQPKVETPKQEIKKEDLPIIGTPNYNTELKVDKESPRAVLARELTPKQIFDRENLIAREFSKVINSSIRTIRKELKKQYKTTTDKSTRLLISDKLSKLNSDEGRRVIIQEMGFENINDAIKDRFRKKIALSDEESLSIYSNIEKVNYIREQYQKILDNYDTLFNEAVIIIENNESIRLTEVEVEDENGEKVHGNEGYTFKIRFVDAHDSCRGVTRRALSDIKQVDSNGNPVLDDLSNPSYLREDYVHSTLLGFLAKEVITPDDFVLYNRKNNKNKYVFPALEKLQENFPWVSQIINKLAHDPNLISAFYTDFRKEFISYWAQFDGRPTRLNTPVEIDSTINGLISNYESGNKQDDNSIYNADLSINKENIEKGKVLAAKITKDLQKADNDDLVDISNDIMKLLKMLGFSEHNISKEIFLSEDNKTITRNVIAFAKDILDKLDSLKEDSHYADTYGTQIENIARLIGKATELDATTTFREMGNDYPSYTAPNELEITFKKLKDNRYRNDFLEKQFKRYDWFYPIINKETGEKDWSNEVLKLIETDSNIRDNMELKNVFMLERQEYSDWNRPIISSAFVREYFYTKEDPEQKHNFAFFNFPIFSDTQMATFIKFKKYTGDFKSSLNPLFRKLIKQELRRMKLVEDRNKLGIPKISSFDDKGAKFCFLPELNNVEVIIDGEKRKLLDTIKYYSQKGYERPDKVEESISIAVNTVMNIKFKEFIENNKSLLEDESLWEFISANSDTSNNQTIENKLEEYFWNQTFMTSQLIQILTTDLAFYKNSVDFQKRFKEVYAAGTRLNTNSPYGRKVEKTVYVSDDIMTSPTYKPLSKIIEEARDSYKISNMDCDSILHKFKDINATDGQAYRSLSSYRAIMDMLGLWNEDLEAAFDRLKKGEWDMGDINVVFQTIKPFVFGHVNTPNGLGDFIKVPHQNKNSEFLLLATYQVLGTVLNKSEQLRALNDFMEDNNIDVVQFESAVKVGGSGIININVNRRKLKDAVTNRKIKVNNKEYSILKDIKLEDITKTFEKVKDYFDSLLDKDSITQEEYNDIMEYFKPNYRETLATLLRYTKTKARETDVLDDEGFNLTSVHKLSYESYMIAQPTPEHVFDVESIFGSQFRNLIASDLPEDIEIEIEGTKIKGKDNVRKFYFSLIVENLLESYKEVAEDFSNIDSLQERLLSIVKGNPKYGRDMLNALELVEYNGRKVFNMPFNDRMIAAKFEELMTSVFKNNITKQYINGASCIAVSNFGLTNELQVERNEDGSVKAIQCYLPATSKKLYEPFLKEIVKNGNVLGYEIDYNKIKKEDESLLEVIGFRIPTEAKYSMLPLKIKGFLPQQNGSAIMLPAEVTTLSGADFDVDKFFLFLPSFRWENTYNLKEAWDDFYQDSENKEIVDNIEANVRIGMIDYIARHPDDSEITYEEYVRYVNSKGKKLYQFSSIEKEDEKENITKAQKKFKEWFKSRKKNYLISKKLERIKYNTSKEPKDNTKAQRDNAIIQLSLGILRNKEVGIASQTPGNFDTLKDTSRVSEIYTNNQYLTKYMQENNLTDIRETIEHLLSSNLDNLDKFMKKNRVEDNPLTLDTFMKYHYQNMTGGTLIGIYANNTTMQAKLQGKNLRLKDAFTFTVDGKLIKNLTDIYTEEVVNGKTIKKRISQNCAEFSAASVDNVKDPVLASLLQNKDTASIACFMLRAGLSIPQIGALFNLPLVSESIRNYGNLKPLDKICEGIEKKVAELKKISEYKAPTITDFNTIDMIEATILYNNESTLDDSRKIELYEKILGFARGFQFIAGISEYLNDTVRAYRADSPNGAIAISLAKAKVQTLRLNDILVKSNKVDYPFEGVDNILMNNYLSLNDTIDEMREKLMNSEMPMLQAFYSLGIDLGLKTLSPYFANASEKANQLIDFIQSNRMRPLKDTDISNIYEAINLFGLSDTNLFGNDDNMNMEEKYTYYTKQFPRDFADIVANNPDIKALPFIQKLVPGINGIEMRNSARNTSYLRELLTNSADSLLYLNNPEAHKLAVGLLRYAYYKEKIKYGPHTFNQFFSTIFKNGFPEYIETLRELENSMETNPKWGRLLDQIYSNNSYLATEVSLEEGEKTITEDGKLITTITKLVRNPNYMAYQPLDYITDNGVLYKLNKELTDESTVYYDKIETSKKGFYNMNNDVNDSVNKLMLYEESYRQKIIEDNKKATITLPSYRRDDNIETGNIMKDAKDEKFFASKEQEWNLVALDDFLDRAEAKAELKMQEEKYSSSEGLKEMDENPCKINIPKDAVSLGSM